MAAVAGVVLDHMRRVIALTHSRSGAVTVALVDAVSALGVLWTLFQYEGIPLPTIAPTVRCFLYQANLQFCQLIGACSSGDLTYLMAITARDCGAHWVLQARDYVHAERDVADPWAHHRMAEVPQLGNSGRGGAAGAGCTPCPLMIIQAIIQDPVFGELHDSLAEIPDKIKEWQHIRETCTIDGGPTESSSSSSSPTALATAEPSSSSGMRVVQARFADPAGDQTLLDEEESAWCMKKSCWFEVSRISGESSFHCEQRISSQWQTWPCRCTLTEADIKSLCKKESRSVSPQSCTDGTVLLTLSSFTLPWLSLDAQVFYFTCFNLEMEISILMMTSPDNCWTCWKLNTPNLLQGGFAVLCFQGSGKSTLQLFSWKCRSFKFQFRKPFGMIQIQNHWICQNSRANLWSIFLLKVFYKSFRMNRPPASSKRQKVVFFHDLCPNKFVNGALNDVMKEEGEVSICVRRALLEWKKCYNQMGPLAQFAHFIVCFFQHFWLKLSALFSGTRGLLSRNPCLLQSRNPFLLQSMKPFLAAKQDPLQLQSWKPFLAAKQDPLQLQSWNPSLLQSRIPLKPFLAAKQDPLQLQSWNPSLLQSRIPCSCKARNLIFLLRYTVASLWFFHAVSMSSSPSCGMAQS